MGFHSKIILENTNQSMTHRKNDEFHNRPTYILEVAHGVVKRFFRVAVEIPADDAGPTLAHHLGEHNQIPSLSISYPCQ